MTASVLADLVKVTTATTGQGALTLGAAVPGFLTPSTVIPAMTSGSVVSYGIADPSQGNEVGQGILTLTGSVWTLTRGVTQSSNGGAPILCTGQATVALTLRAEDVFQGFVKLASGTLPSPGAPFLDFVLPPDFLHYRIQFVGVRFVLGGAANDYLAAVISCDGGVTFVDDAVNFDSYINNSGAIAANQGTGEFASFNDGNIDLSFAITATPSTAIVVSADIYVGSDTDFPQLYFTSGADSVLGYTLSLSNATFNKAAMVPPPHGRATVIRFAPAGTEVLNPPNSGHLMTMDQYILWGVSP